MDTKWRNNKGIIVWLILFAIGVTGTLNLIGQYNKYFGKSFYESDEFDVNFYDEFLNYLNVAELANKSAEELKNSLNVTKGDIKEYRYRYGDLTEQVSNIQSQYQEKIDDAKASNDKSLETLYREQRDKKIEDIQKNFKSDKYVQQKVKKEKEEQIDQFIENKKQVQRDFNNQWDPSFDYYLQNNETAEVFTNMNVSSKEEAYSKLVPEKTQFLKVYTPNKEGYLSTNGRMPGMEGDEEVNSRLLSEKQGDYHGRIAVPKSLPDNSWLFIQSEDFKKRQLFYYINGIVGVIALIASLWIARRKQLLSYAVSDSKYKAMYGKLPMDARLGFLALSMLLCLTIVSMNMDYMSDNRDYYLLIGVYFILSITLIQLIWFVAIQKEAGLSEEQWRQTWLYRMWRTLGQALQFNSLSFQLLILLIVILASGFGLGVIYFQSGLGGIYLFLFVTVTVPTLLIMLKKLSYFNSIVLHSKQLAAGNLEPDLPAKGRSVFAQLAHSIDQLKHGVKSLQKSEAKSERLKTELITNVSHDLRTPLTSIISYTELLKTPDLDEESREAYVQIIDRKSQRLKVLIDDLFEASKMASGNIELKKERVDIVQLLQQTLGEYDEVIEKSTLQIRMSASEQPIFTYVDGQKIWRVFDNLIGNILKYSLENTRVYISVVQRTNRALITFKNVSKYELGGNTDELFERFKRGDTSRHTEGSGLGLAIAKSILDLHEGAMEVEADGDLFKVIIELDLA